ncbi:GRIP and coiled-coil domain-containing protein 2-like [Salvelinus fontinalis]|uniref:GRIP and coiled-coil domain-containing protein 2-like n=1 Tax=Salvelinus fontinalis TaxID=8038 RepID=UPI002484E0D2|nr:GRIP and coiled-coil domain-containing protein 2-like [Salvelinus fontinalis]
MEDTGSESVASPPSGAAKSKLDTLSKDDLIKFAKKQMAAIQKMKSKCADLEKEVDTLKSQPTGNSDDSVIQELTERMSALLLEKAETQQSAVLLRKENEKAKQREQDAIRKLATLQGELNQAKEDQQKKMATFEKTMHVSQAKHKEEVEFFQRLLREKDERDREKEKHREREKEDTNDSVEAVSHSLKLQILSLQTELAAAVERSAQEAAALQEDHQRAQTEAQQEVENIREELAQHSMQHEEELRALEEDFEMERERLLLLQEELSEQLALKDSFLQDVQEEEEEPSGRSSGIARMLELSGLSQIDASDGETETGQLRSALEDLQSQNTMLQDELTFLGNVKTQLEAELERMREEFQTEKEELEFKIDELLMTREGATPDLNMTPYRDPLSPATPKCDLQEVPALTHLQQSGPQREPAYSLPASSASPSSPFPDTDHQSLTLEEQQRLILEVQELRNQCETLARENTQAVGECESLARERRQAVDECEYLARERGQAVAECEHTRDILRGLETELGQRTGDFVRQYEAMKEQGASAIQELQERVRGLTEERESLVEKLRGLNEDRDSLLEKIQGLEKRLESFLEQTQAAEGLKEHLQTSLEEKTELALEFKTSLEEKTVLASELKASLEEQTALTLELKASVEDLSRQNGEILSQLQMKESAVQELEDSLNVVSTERDQTLSALQEMEVVRLREVEGRQGQRERVAELQACIEELEKERSLLKSSLGEVQGSPGEEVEELQACVEKLEKERNLLKCNLGELVGDTEALQRDLGEMKLANEKMRTENQELLAQVSNTTETLADKEREQKVGAETEREEEKQEERRALQQQLTEKDKVISQLKSEMAVLQSTASTVSEKNTEFTEKIGTFLITTVMENFRTGNWDTMTSKHRGAVLTVSSTSINVWCVFCFQAELSFVTTEFDSYKVRVHNVLKQQKNKSSAQSDGHATKQEREQMESMVDQYKAKLQDSQQSLAVSTAEFQQLQMEHDTLLERHNKILQETVTKEAELRERLLSLQAESMSLRTELAQTVGQLTSQADAQRSGFREQIRHLQDEHRTTVETLQNQMTRLENQLFTLQSQTAPVQTSRKPVVDRRTVDQGAMGGLGLGLSDLQSMAREEGEGMETTETESLSPPHTPLPSLEHLLTSPDPKQEPFVWQVEPTKEELSQKLATATRSMEHMNSLLHETEATNAVLMEQVNLLKSEVRRLERNHEREKSVANLEYLKNVLLQFIFLRSGSERRALLPVIHTMLKLSPEEKNKLAAIAMGEEEVGGAKGSGWTSYLHSWSGIR